MITALIALAGIIILTGVLAKVQIHFSAKKSVSANQQTIAELEAEIFGIGTAIKDLPDWTWDIEHRTNCFHVYLRNENKQVVDSKVVSTTNTLYDADSYRRTTRKLTESEIEKEIQKSMKAMVKNVTDKRQEQEMIERIVSKYKTVRPQDTLESR